MVRTQRCARSRKYSTSVGTFCCALRAGRYPEGPNALGLAPSPSLSARMPGSPTMEEIRCVLNPPFCVRGAVLARLGTSSRAFRFAWRGWPLIHPKGAGRTKLCSSHNRSAPEAVTSARADVRGEVAPSRVSAPALRKVAQPKLKAAVESSRGRGAEGPHLLRSLTRPATAGSLLSIHICHVQRESPAAKQA